MCPESARAGLSAMRRDDHDNDHQERSRREGQDYGGDAHEDPVLACQPLPVLRRHCGRTIAGRRIVQAPALRTGAHIVCRSAAGQRASWPVGRVLCTRVKRAGGHPSRAAIANSLVRSTREHRAGRPQSLAQGTRDIARVPLLTLLRVGFTEPPGSLRALVVSYTAVSPLPPASRGRSVFCGTIPRVAPGRRYRSPCPAEPGPSSTPPGDQAGAAAARPARPLLRPG
jgi:hypothetical protein